MSSQYPDAFDMGAIEGISLIGLDEEASGQPLFGPPPVEEMKLLETAKKYPSKRCQIVEEAKDHTGRARITVAYEVERNVMKTFTLSSTNWESLQKDWFLLGKHRVRVLVFEQQAEKYGMNRYEIWKRYLDLANVERKLFIKQENRVLERLQGYDRQTLR